MPIAVHRCRDGGVAEAGLDFERVPAGSNQERRAGVAEVVPADVLLVRWYGRPRGDRTATVAVRTTRALLSGRPFTAGLNTRRANARLQRFPTPTREPGDGSGGDG